MKRAELLPFLAATGAGGATCSRSRLADYLTAIRRMTGKCLSRDLDEEWNERLCCAGDSMVPEREDGPPRSACDYRLG